MNFPQFCKRLLPCLLAVLCTVGTALADAAEALPALIERIKPSVLAVGYYGETQSPRFAFRGTGFVAGGGNLLITNAHVIERAGANSASDGLRLVVASKEGADQGRVRRAEVLDLDRAHDLALLRFEGPALPLLQPARAGSVREGQAVALMGFPLGGALGFAPVTHRGMISSVTSVALPSPSARQLDDRAINRIREGAFEMLQLDATAYPGNSGGPLFDTTTGEVVGVVNMVTLKGTRESALTNPSGITYAIPVEFVLKLLAPHVRK